MAKRPPVEGVADKVLSSKNGWSASWDGLPANKAGERIAYTVDEVDVPEGYELTGVSCVQEDGSYVFTVTNSAKDVAPSPSEDGEQDSNNPSAPNPSKPNAQSADGVSSKPNVQSGSRGEVAKKASSNDGQGSLPKTGDDSRIGAVTFFAVGSLCVAAAARRMRHDERG